MAIGDPPLLELIISIRSTTRGLAIEWRLIDHGPYPGPPPHPFQPLPPPVEVVRGSQEVDVGLEGVVDGHLDADTAATLFKAVPAGLLAGDQRTRISLVLGPLSPPGNAIWWEDAVAEHLATGPVTVVRRGLVPITTNPVLPYDLRAGGPGPGRVAITDMLDDWTLDAAAGAGGLVVHDPDDPAPVDILHLVLPTPGVSDPAWLLGPGTPPLLVGVWWQERPDPGRLAGVLTGLLDKGVAAVVLLATDDATRARSFFRMLYRKVFHDLPIDVAVREAAGWAALDPRDRLLVAANPGGETALLLSRAALQQVEQWAPSASAPPVGRAERVVAELESGLRDQVRVTWDNDVQAGWDRLAHAQYGAEEHDVAISRSVSDAIDAMRPPALEALAGLRSVDAGEAAKAATRLLQAWVDEGGRQVAPGSPLEVGRRYDLSVQVSPKVLPGAATTPFPDQVLAEVFRTAPDVTLDVCFFAVDDDVALDGPARSVVRLPRFGASTVAQVGFRPLRDAVARIRVTVAYRGVLLQSVVMEADAGKGLRLLVDYVASADLALLDEHAQPVMSIFTNAAEDGSTHWVGVFAADDSVSQLMSGRPTVISDDLLEKASKSLRALMTTLSGSGDEYFYADARVALDGEQQRRGGALVSLAVDGYAFWDKLLGANSPTGQLASNPAQVLGRPGVVTVARCDARVTRSLPWAALYDFHLNDSGRRDADGVPSGISVCPEFDGQIDADPHFLDDPAACHARPACPLRDLARRATTVCPFGFLGARYQVEQPIQTVTPTPVGQVPPELLGRSFDQTAFLTPGPAAPTLSMALAVAPELPDGDDHVAELRALAGLSITARSDYADVLAALVQGGADLQYFYCHGEVDTNELRLRLGPQDDPGWLSVGNLSDPTIDWPAEPRPLVFLNGCQTVAVTTETANLFLQAFRRLGASGVIGTEIEVFNVLARNVGTDMLRRFLEGESLGEALLSVRLGLLRARNPLGLVFTLHGPAALHVHQAAGCRWCAGHASKAVGVA